MAEVIDMGKEKRIEQPLRVVIYGPAGVGKTTLMRDFPKPMLVYDFDGKYEPLIGVEGIFIKSYRISERKESQKTWLEFWNDWKKDKKDEKWKTIVLDSLTALDSIMFWAMVQMSGMNPEVKGSYVSNTLQLYGDVKNQYSTLFNSMRSVCKNVIVLAHESFNTDDRGNTESITPLVTGGTKASLPAIFKDVWYMELSGEGKNMKRKLHTRKFKMRVATTTTIEDLEPIEDPTYEKIMENYKR